MWPKRKSSPNNLKQILLYNLIIFQPLLLHRVDGQSASSSDEASTSIIASIPGNLEVANPLIGECQIKECPSNKEGVPSKDQFAIDYDSMRWTWGYIEEHFFKQTIIVNDDFMDQRLANIISLSSNARPENADTQRLNLGSQQLDLQAEQQIAGPKVDEKKCRRDLEAILDQMDEMDSILNAKRQNASSTRKLEVRHLLLSHYLESFGRYESGQLQGKLFIVGSYEQCMKSQLHLGESSPTSNRFCWAKFKLDHLNPGIKATMFAKNLALNAGICLPESCHIKTSHTNMPLIQKLVNTQFKLPTSIYLHENLEIESVYCAPDPDSEFGMPLSGKLFILFVIGWLLLVVKVNLDGQKNSVLSKALNIADSWRDFLSNEVKTHDSRVDLNTINMMKNLSSLCVLIGHVAFFLGTWTDQIITIHSTVELSMLETAISGNTIFVDTFFAISGLLLTFIVLKKLHLNPSLIQKDGRFSLKLFFKQWFMLVVARFARLLPVYYMVFWFQKSVMRHISSGPLWDYGLNVETKEGYCRQESWLTPLLCRSPYLPLSLQCLNTTWSVGGDMLASIIVAPIILILALHPNLTIPSLLVTAVASLVALFGDNAVMPTSMRQDLANVRTHILSMAFRHFSVLYSATEYHIHSIFLGILGGYALFKYDIADRNYQWPRWFRGPVTALSAIVCLFLYGLLPAIAFLKTLKYYSYEDDIPEANLHFITTGRFAWVLGNVILFVRLATDWKDTWVGRICASQISRAWSKLLLIFLLIHLEFMLYEIQSRVQVPVYTRQQLYYSTVYLFTVCMTVSMAIFVLFENPVDKLTKILLVGAPKSKSSS